MRGKWHMETARWKEELTRGPAFVARFSSLSWNRAHPLCPSCGVYLLSEEDAPPPPAGSEPHALVHTLHF